MAYDKLRLTESLEKMAREQGFAAFGLAPAALAPATAQRLHDWLAGGQHGDMIWMESRADERASPQVLWPDVRSVIMLGMSYAPERDPFALEKIPDHGRISVYAQGKDYHDVVKRALKRTARWLVENADCQVKVFVDTAPVLENRLPKRPVWAGRASIPIWLVRTTAVGCFWVRFIQVWKWSHRLVARTAVAVVLPVRIFAPPTRFRSPIGWMPKPAFLI